jgi:hypothetical protein
MRVNPTAFRIFANSIGAFYLWFVPRLRGRKILFYQKSRGLNSIEMFSLNFGVRSPAGTRFHGQKNPAYMDATRPRRWAATSTKGMAGSDDQSRVLA